jgi:hypothetical protein
MVKAYGRTDEQNKKILLKYNPGGKRHNTGRPQKGEKHQLLPIISYNNISMSKYSTYGDRTGSNMRYSIKMIYIKQYCNSTP